jgi:hypothetical protein
VQRLCYDVGRSQSACQWEASTLIHSDALINAILGLALLTFFVGHRRAIRQLPMVVLLFLAYALAMLAWIAGLLDSVLIRESLHTLVHIAYAASGITFAAWCWIGLRSGKRSQP